MIHDLAVALQTSLRERRCPFPVVDGPERTKPNTYASERVVVEEPEDQSTRTTSPRSQSINPKRRLEAAVPVKITVYACAPAANALDFEHVRRASSVVDLVLVGVEEFVRSNKLGWSAPEFRRVRPADLEASEKSPGAAYEIKLSIARGVVDRMWNGDAKPEVTLGPGGVPIVHTDLIGAAGQDPDTNVETACAVE